VLDPGAELERLGAALPLDVWFGESECAADCDEAMLLLLEAVVQAESVGVGKVKDDAEANGESVLEAGGEPESEALHEALGVSREELVEEMGAENRALTVPPSAECEEACVRELGAETLSRAEREADTLADSDGGEREEGERGALLLLLEVADGIRDTTEEGEAVAQEDMESAAEGDSEACAELERVLSGDAKEESVEKSDADGVGLAVRVIATEPVSAAEVLPDAV
jgi:hypothetical protein